MAEISGKKQESRARIVASAGRGFRALGYGGLGVDGLAKEAGVTSGAFYANFKSKADAFRAAVAAGMEGLANGVARHRTEGGNWVDRFVDFYLGERRHAALAESCALQSLTGEVARADTMTRHAYEVELSKIIALLESGMAHDSALTARQQAISLLAMLSGGVSMSRAVADPVVAQEIAEAINITAKNLLTP